MYCSCSLVSKTKIALLQAFTLICVSVCRFEKATLEYQEQLSAVTGIDCSIGISDYFMPELSDSRSSPKHTGTGNQQIIFLLFLIIYNPT